MILAALLSLFLGLAPLIVKSDSYEHKDYNWVQNRERYPISADEELKTSISLKHLVAHEYLFEEDSGDLIVYNTVHRIIRVNSDDAIQTYNKIYIPMNDVYEIVNVRARSINPSGKSMELDQSNIKEIEDDDGLGAYKIFAIEGVEQGSEIEYFYTRKMYASYFGREYLQSEIDSKNISFHLISPSHLIFMVKGYNGVTGFQDTVSGSKRHINLNIMRVPGIREEAFAFSNANRGRVEFKLGLNENRENRELLSWADAAQRIHSNMYDWSEEESKELEKFYKILKIKAFDEKEKVMAIENHIKANFSIQEGSGPEYNDLIAILSNKYASKRGISRLYGAMFKTAGIVHQLVLTSDRSNVKFDPDFQSWNYLVKYIFHFPKLDKYLAPEDPELRLGMIPARLTNNYGLFIEMASVGDFETGLGKINFIPALEHNQNFDNLRVELMFNADMDKALINITRKLGGYPAAFIQPYYRFLPDDKKRQVAENYIKLSADDAHFNDLEIENWEGDLSPLKDPFIIKSKIESASIFERAGNRFLLKLGEVIGPQTELYQEKERILDVENEFNRLYDRNIRVTIPPGYRVKNLDDLNMYVAHEKDGEPVFLFRSEYDVEGDVINVQVDEYYTIIDREVQYFEEFRKVINAAADFNKITLVLEKI